MGKALDLASSLGQDVLNGWSSNTVNPGAAFLNGEATTAFAISNQASNISNTAAGLVGNAGNVYQSGSALVQQLGQGETWLNLASSIKTGVTNAALKAFNDEIIPYSEALAKQMALDTTTCWTTYFAQRVGYWTAASTQTSITYYLSLLTESVDKRMEKMNKQKDDEEKDKGMKKAAASISYMYKAVSTATSYVQNGIDTAMKLINAGPEYIESTLTKTINSVLVPAKKELAAIVKDGTDEMYKQSDKLAKVAGTRAAKVINDTVMSAAKTLKAKTEAAKIQVLSIAMAAIKIVEQKAMALLGM